MQEGQRDLDLIDVVREDDLHNYIAIRTQHYIDQLKKDITNPSVYAAEPILPFHHEGQKGSFGASVNVRLFEKYPIDDTGFSRNLRRYCIYTEMEFWKSEPANSTSKS
jgi:hypothetical protein